MRQMPKGGDTVMHSDIVTEGKKVNPFNMLYMIPKAVH